MHDLSNFMSDYKFNPSLFDSVLNPHSVTQDNSCNIDKSINCDCKYYDNMSINDGVLNQNSLSLFHLNCRSLNKRASNVVDYLSTINHDFDIIAFTETWFNSADESNLIDLNNYTKIDCIRTDRSGGGASLFINLRQKFIQRPDLNLNTP